MGTKSQTAAADTPYDMEGVVNTENPVESLGTLDLGDDVESGQEGPVEEPEVEETPTEEETEETEEEPAEEAEEEAPEEEPEAEEAEEEAPEEEPEAEEPEKPAKGKEPAIPKSRFDQRTAQLRAAERRLEEMQAKLTEQETARQKAEREANTMSDEQLQAKMTEANAALVEGDTEKAAKLQSEVFGAMGRGQQAGEPAEKVDPAKIAADVRDQMTFENAVKAIGEKYPALDENSETFDEAVSQEAVGFQKMYFDQGYTRAEATEKAADAVAAIHRLDGAAEPEPQAEKPAAKAAMAKKAQTASRKGKVAAAKRAPPPAGGNSGANSDSADSVDLDAITVEDWAALPDSVRSRLMGDAG